MAILAAFPGAACNPAFASILMASTAVQPPDLNCSLLLGLMPVFRPLNLISQDLMDSFNRQLKAMDLV